jgi:hypothetical protein
MISNAIKFQDKCPRNGGIRGTHDAHDLQRFLSFIVELYIIRDGVMNTDAHAAGKHNSGH